MMQYACTFGVELQLDNMAADYFFTRFKLNQSMASIAASSFGLCNLFARAMGGMASDAIATKYGMRGRLALQLFILWGTGCLVIAFALQTNINTSVTAMIFFSIFAEVNYTAKTTLRYYVSSLVSTLITFSTYISPYPPHH